MRFDRGGFEATRIIVAIEVGSDLEAGLGSGGAGVVENLLIGAEWFAGPVSRDLGEEAKRRCSMGFHLEAPVG